MTSPMVRMLIVSNAIRNDLQHPNEYVCGMTLRFLCKLQEQELLEPLLPPCRACLVTSSIYISSLLPSPRAYIRLGTPPFIRSEKRCVCNLLDLPSFRTSHPRCPGPHSHVPPGCNIPNYIFEYGVADICRRETKCVNAMLLSC